MHRRDSERIICRLALGHPGGGLFGDWRCGDRLKKNNRSQPRRRPIMIRIYPVGNICEGVRVQRLRLNAPYSLSWIVSGTRIRELKPEVDVR